MKDGGKVNIKLIETDPDYRERHTPWTEAMDSFLRDSFVKRAGGVRIVVKKTGGKYVLVAGHHLLKAAKACGLKDVYVDVVDSGQEEYLSHFAEVVADNCRRRETFHELCAHC
ncbi:MAG TPA: ParB/Srx family N-terminal domain-containing protein [Syntrophorhabdales bacterium]|nr:ParB/Srx family N-terminal domain-containing protein [Syntrophorhabdales bacterium]